MKEKIPARKPDVLKFIRAALLGASISAPIAAAGNDIGGRVVDTLLARYELDESSISKYLDDLKARLKAIKEKQSIKPRLVEMMERMAESVRTGRLIRDDEFVIQSQIVALDGVKTIQNISYWVGLFSLWGTLTAVLTGILYRKQKFDEVHAQTDYLSAEQEEVNEKIKDITLALGKLLSVLESVAKNSPGNISPDQVGQLEEAKKLLEETFGVGTEELVKKLSKGEE